MRVFRVSKASFLQNTYGGLCPSGDAMLEACSEGIRDAGQAWRKEGPSTGDTI